MRIDLPEFCLVVLAGAAGSGKSAFAGRHFREHEILSIDAVTKLLGKTVPLQEEEEEAAAILHSILSARLQQMRLTVVDAPNLHSATRQKLVEIARRYFCDAIAIVIDAPEKLCEERAAAMASRDRAAGRQSIHLQCRTLRRGLRGLRDEGFRSAHVLLPREADQVELHRHPLACDRREDSGPFDIIGDLHGCCDELEELLARLGYRDGAHPHGRKAIFLGDLVDRGPRILDCLRLVRRMVDAGQAYCVAGNHDWKLARWLRGQKVTVAHGLQQSIDELGHLSGLEKSAICRFLENLAAHYVLDHGRLVIAHAGLREEMHGRSAPAIRNFCMYGETTGETDEFGLPVRYNWALEYRGAATVVYGHTPVPRPDWLHNTINIDTGCVFGGRLTALRYPERELVSVDARREYTPSIRPFSRDPFFAPSDLPEAEDLTRKRSIQVALLRHPVSIREESASRAFEELSRFAIDPHWLIYLPPAISPCDASSAGSYLEHPEEAFRYYREQKVRQLFCQERSFGTRAVLVVAKDPDAAAARFRTGDRDRFGVCYTSRGRALLQDHPAVDTAMLERVRGALLSAGLFDELQTNWFCLDAEVLPWPDGSTLAAAFAAEAGIRRAADLLELTPARPPLDGLLEHTRQRLDAASRFVDQCRHHNWPVHSVDYLKITPRLLVATEAESPFTRDRNAQHALLARLCAADPGLFRTPQFRIVDSESPEQCAEAAAWWQSLTEQQGAAAIDVGPCELFAATPDPGLAQPSLLCRGREYLKAFYGPEYMLRIDALRQRSLTTSRGLALRQFALAMEGLTRFSKREPFTRVHECVFGILALQCQDLDAGS